MLKDGLTEEEWKTLHTPLGSVGSKTLMQEIIRINDKRITAVRAENEKFTPRKRAPLKGAAVISDDLGTHGVLNHADGKRYDSKSEFRKATKRAGCVEIGNEKPKDWKPPEARPGGVQGDFDVKPALKQALQQHGVK